MAATHESQPIPAGEEEVLVEAEHSHILTCRKRVVNLIIHPHHHHSIEPQGDIEVSLYIRSASPTLYIPDSLEYLMVLLSRSCQRLVII